MGIVFKFDAEKAVEVLLYIAEKCPDVYKALKVLYFADKEHLAQYGRLVCGNSYVAMSHGPVPSGAYDLIKYARRDGFWDDNVSAEKAFSIESNSIVSHRKADLRFLSESDRECLDAAIQRYGNMPFSKLKALSHDSAFKSADQNDFISLDALAKSLPNGDLLSDYLRGQ